MPARRGTLIHEARWCTGDPFERSRRGTLADKRVQRKKREDIAAAKPAVLLNGTVLDNVYQFTYLGSVQCAGGDTMEDTLRRIAQATAKYTALLHVWSDNQLSRDLRVKLYYVRISTVLLYGSETWLLDTRTCQRLRGFRSRCMTQIFGQPAADILRKNLGGDIIRVVQKRRWLWLGHALRMDNSRFARQVFDAVYPGHRQPPFPSGSLPALLPGQYMRLRPERRPCSLGRCV